jgi:hypothetical protein
MKRSTLAALVITAVAVVSAAVIVGMFFFGGPVTPGGGSDKVAETVSQPLAEEVPPVTQPSAKPTVEPYATKLSGRVITADPKASAMPEGSLPPYANGCDFNYGQVPLCVPYNFPEGVKTVQDKCAWLASHNFKKIPVSGQDRQGLDADKNGIACDR